MIPYSLSVRMALRGLLTYNELLNETSFPSATSSGLQLYFGLWALLTLSESGLQ